MTTTMILAPAPVQQYTDNNGVLLSGGKLFCYAAGTTTKQSAFTDATGDTALPNPIILNSRGEVAPSAIGTSCGLWMDPTLAYKFVLSPSTDSDPPTNPFWTIDNVVSPQTAILAALANYQANLGGVPIGSQMSYAGSTAPAGWLLCYGQAISRTTYASLFAIIGTSYGIGDASTTFNLPDKRGRASIGADNMGGSAANRVTNGVSGVNAAAIGNVGGDQHAQADTLVAATVLSLTFSDPGHTHSVLIATAPSGGATGGVAGTAGAPSVVNFAGNTTNSTGISVGGSATTTVTTGLTGAAQNMIPVQVDNVIIFCGIA